MRSFYQVIVGPSPSEYRVGWSLKGRAREVTSVSTSLPKWKALVHSSGRGSGSVRLDRRFTRSLLSFPRLALREGNREVLVDEGLTQGSCGMVGGEDRDHLLEVWDWLRSREGNLRNLVLPPWHLPSQGCYDIG